MVKAAKTSMRDGPEHAPGQNTIVLPDGHNITHYTVGKSQQPVILFVVGSSGLGSLYRRLASELSAHFQCVYYDKRGFLAAGTDDEFVARQTNQLVLAGDNADDAAAIIKLVSPHKPAYVFGTSTGGTAVLDLAVRYPELIHTAILHEPITFSVMPQSAMKDEILTLYRSLASWEDQVEGSNAFAAYMFHPHCQETSSALQQVLRRGGKSHPEAREESKTARKTAAAFNARQGEQEGDAMLAYEVDVERARSVRDKILLVRGSESVDWPISQPVKALAQALGDKQAVCELVGGHLSFAGRREVATFAGQLVSLLHRKDGVLSTEAERKARL